MGEMYLNDLLKKTYGEALQEQLNKQGASFYVTNYMAAGEPTMAKWQPKDIEEWYAGANIPCQNPTKQGSINTGKWWSMVTDKAGVGGADGYGGGAYYITSDPTSYKLYTDLLKTSELVNKAVGAIGEFADQPTAADIAEAGTYNTVSSTPTTFWAAIPLADLPKAVQAEIDQISTPEKAEIDKKIKK